MARLGWLRRRVRSRRRCVFAALLAVAVVAVLVFGLRAFRSWQVFQAARTQAAGERVVIRPWMTIRHIARIYRVQPSDVTERLRLPGDTDPDITLRAVARQQERSIPDIIRDIYGIPPNPPSPPTPPRPPGPGGGP